MPIRERILILYLSLHVACTSKYALIIRSTGTTYTSTCMTHTQLMLVLILQRTLLTLLHVLILLLRTLFVLLRVLLELLGIPRILTVTAHVARDYRLSFKHILLPVCMPLLVLVRTCARVVMTSCPRGAAGLDSTIYLKAYIYTST